MQVIFHLIALTIHESGTNHSFQLDPLIKSDLQNWSEWLIHMWISLCNSKQSSEYIVSLQEDFKILIISYICIGSGLDT